ncbi:MAG: hypothetical protein ABEH64_12295 [Salinirussus sp.]
MQRRAAAVYFMLFVVVGAGAYAFLGVMSEPAGQLDGPTYEAGDTFSAGGVTFTVNSSSAGEGVVSYRNGTSGAVETVELGEGENVTLGGVQHFTHYTDGGVQVLPTDQYWDAYQGELAVQDTYHERRAGVWAVVILSFLAGAFLLATAYMPVRG